MIVLIDMPGLRAHIKMIIVWTIVTLAIVPTDISFAKDARGPSPAMADVMFYMSSYKDLPVYCQVKMTEIKLSEKFKTRDVPAQFAKIRAKWSKAMGNSINWNHFHHYCFGIIRLNEAQRMTGGSEEIKMRRKATLNSALEEFEYIRRSKTDGSFPLWSQLYMYESQIYTQLGQPAMAQRAMQQSVNLQKRRKSSQ